jgi:rhodanese-related sulfurtransferase
MIPLVSQDAGVHRPMTTSIPILTLDDVVRLQAATPPLILVEALSPMLYQAAHLPGAVNIPIDQVEMLAPALLPDKDAAIAVYCATRACGTAHRVALRLVQLGYTQVAHYQGGKQEWIIAGLPLEGQS